MSATPIYGEEKQNGVVRSKQRNLSMCVPLHRSFIEKELTEKLISVLEMIDMKDVFVLWLPGGVAAYLDVKKDGGAKNQIHLYGMFFFRSMKHSFVA